MGLHLAKDWSESGTAVRLTTNSNTIVEAALESCNILDVQELLQKGIEVTMSGKQQKELNNLNSSANLHYDEHQAVYIDDITGSVLDPSSRLPPGSKK